MDKVKYCVLLECGCIVTGLANARSPLVAGSELVKLHCNRHGLQYPKLIDLEDA